MTATDSQPVRPPAEYYNQDDSTNTCFLCGDPDFETVYRVEHFGYPFVFSRCRTCGIEKQTPMPNEQFFAWFFNSELFFSAKDSEQDHIWGFYDYFKDEPCRMATSKHRYKLFSRWLEKRKPLDILKIGPSTGTFLAVANEHGHNAIGVDVSNRFVEYAKENYDVRIDEGRFERMDYADESFDVILLFNVVENIPNLDEFMRSVFARLRPGGLFIVNYVDMKRNVIAAMQGSKYFMYRPPICYIFDRHVIRRMLEKYGFAVEASYRDWRTMHLEKIFTLLGWRWALRIAQALKIAQIRFPIYAYPSKLLVTRKA